MPVPFNIVVVPIARDLLTSMTKAEPVGIFNVPFVVSKFALIRAFTPEVDCIVPVLVNVPAVTVSREDEVVLSSVMMPLLVKPLATVNVFALLIVRVAPILWVKLPSIELEPETAILPVLFTSGAETVVAFKVSAALLVNVPAPEIEELDKSKVTFPVLYV